MFDTFKKAVQDQFKIMSENDNTLFVTGVTKDDLWEKYLSSFPAGTNPIFRERTEHDCQCCRQFIRTMGNVVIINDNKLISIWDIKIDNFYQEVADALATLVKSAPVADTFLHYENKVGTDFNLQLAESGTTRWEHFSAVLPSRFVKPKDSIGTTLSELRSGKEVFNRALQEITQDSINTVLEIIEQDSLYRGAEHKGLIATFSLLSRQFHKLPADARDNFCWVMSKQVGPAMSRIRNTAIGTLLTDLSDGVDLNDAVKLFESKVAPANYKRPTALITKSMIEAAQKKVQELGIEDSLPRRYAVATDITVNNVLFADRGVRSVMQGGSVFDELLGGVTQGVKNLEKVDEIGIEDFLKNVLSHATTLEVLVENRFTNNLMSLIAPKFAEAPSILKWGNNFSWSYAGEVTDSIKERVKKAGGNVSGEVCCRLAWNNTDDLDFHMKEPDGYEIFYINRRRLSPLKRHA